VLFLNDETDKLLRDSEEIYLDSDDPFIGLPPLYCAIITAFSWKLVESSRLKQGLCQIHSWVLIFL
jgi:hypothetical protein